MLVLQNTGTSRPQNGGAVTQVPPVTRVGDSSGGRGLQGRGAALDDLVGADRQMMPSGTTTEAEQPCEETALRDGHEVPDRDQTRQTELMTTLAENGAAHGSSKWMGRRGHNMPDATGQQGLTWEVYRCVGSDG